MTESLGKGISTGHLFDALSFASLVKEILLCILLENSQSTQNLEEKQR